MLGGMTGVWNIGGARNTSWNREISGPSIPASTESLIPTPFFFKNELFGFPDCECACVYVLCVCVWACVCAFLCVSGCVCVRDRASLFISVGVNMYFV